MPGPAAIVSRARLDAEFGKGYESGVLKVKKKIRLNSAELKMQLEERRFGRRLMGGERLAARERSMPSAMAKPRFPPSRAVARSRSRRIDGGICNTSQVHLEGGMDS